VLQEVDDRLRQSLHFAVEALLNLPKADSPGQVLRSPLVAKPWSITVEDDRRAGFAMLPEDMTIWRVFQQPEVKKQLLILGEPGSGKTTSMLEIAQGLLDVAQLDNTQPIPVLLNLSSWKQEQPIFEWVLTELTSKYKVRVDLGREWLIAGKLIPLLDGLDEVRTDWQLECSAQLSAWIIGDLEQRPPGVIVCCRIEEYEKIVQQKLVLFWAVCLQSLGVEQIDNYLRKFELDVVADTVVKDESLRELISKPLFLSMFGLVARQGVFDVYDWQQRLTEQSRQEYLTDLYWKAVMQRELVNGVDKTYGKLSETYGCRELPSFEKVERALIFLAKSLNHDCQTEFLLERLSPAHLERGKQECYKFYYAFAFSIIMIAVTSLNSKVANSVNSVAANSVGENFIDFKWQFIFSGLILSVPWFKYVLHLDDVILADRFDLKELLISLNEILPYRFVLSIISSILLLAGSLKSHDIGTEWVNLLFIILVPLSGVAVNMSIQWIFLHSQAKIDEPKVVNQGVKNALKNILLLVSIVTCIFLLVWFRLLFGITSIVEGAVIFPMLLTYFIYIVFIAFLEGGRGFVQHVALRLVLWQNGYAPPRYDRLLDYCTERLLLQRIGGRYRFMHKLLQDHFAAMDLD
jgi:NACHT domain